MQRYNKNDVLTMLSKLIRNFHSKYSVHAKKTTKISDIIATFDIETTSTYLEGEKFAFMYEWSFCLMDDDNTFTFYGRTWEEFIDLLDNIHHYYLLNDNRKFIIWVHNLSFEFQFMRKVLKGKWEVFAGDVRKPYKAENNDFIFRDTLILSAMPLSKVADNLTSHKIKKLVGDLDYCLIRHSETEMTKEELGYCENDVLIVAYYIQEQKEIYGSLTKIPLTNTGRVRQFVKNNCFHSSPSNHRKDSKGKRTRYQALMQECKLTEETYKLLLVAFQGGFTHANPCYSGMIVKDVHSIDFTSSYPAVMLSEKYPMSKPQEIQISSKDEFIKLLEDDNVGLLFVAEFHNLQANIIFENYLSESKAVNIKNPVSNNGRIFSADSATYVLTDIDFSIIKKCYSWDSITLGKMYKFYMSYLPKSIIKSILELYTKKTTLKGVEGKETEYLVSKGMLNSVYGMCVTAIVKDENVYNDEWSVNPAEWDIEINKYNENKQRFLYYPWGVWVTSYARRNLWKGILSIADDYIYSDTDSIKFMNYEKHKPFIESYNKEITEKINKMLEWYHIDYTTPKTIKGKSKPIGVWDYEGMYNRFKTLGAKRYMYEIGDELHITIAGLSKKQGRDYIAKQDKPFDFFNNEMYIPADSTGKMTHTYIDDIIEGDIVDYQGKTNHVVSNSSVHLEKVEFTLSQSQRYLDFLDELQHGYLLTSISGGRLVK